MRAAFILGGFAVLANQMRSAGRASVQAVTITAAHDALTDDLTDGVLDGNDGNDARAGTGLELGECPVPSSTCEVSPGECSLAACRPACSLYANTMRSLLAQSIASYVGSRTLASSWNRSGIHAEDVKPLLDRVANRFDPELFGEACLENSDRLPPLIVWEEPHDFREWVRDELLVSAVAIDDSPLGARMSFRGVADEDGDPNDHRAHGRVQTTGFADGPIVVIAEASDRAGNRVEEARTFWVDNTAPQITLDTADGGHVAAGVWWSASSAVVLRGTVTEAQLATVEVRVGELVVATATVDADAGTWAASIPAGHLSAEVRLVTARARDRAGNETTSTPMVLRVDAVAPTVTLLRSDVYDETHSTFTYEGDQQRHVVGGAAVDLSSSRLGACAVVAKHAHLLGAGLPLGATGALNSLGLRAEIRDDGIGLRPETVQVQVTVTRSDGSELEVLPWRVLPTASGAIYEVPISTQGALAMPALLTTEGTYRVSLRASDWLGNASVVESRCWQHRTLPPELWHDPNGGSKAEGFTRALYSTSLSPGPGQAGNFSSKLLNGNAEGAAVWVRRLRNYVGLPVRLRFSVDRGVSGTVQKQFVVRRAAVDRQSVWSDCGTRPCTSLPQAEVHTPPLLEVPHTEARFSVRVFLASGSELGAELLPCAGCEVDEEQQRYAFEIPARGSAGVAEYVVATYLRPGLPAGAGVNLLLAPTDDSMYRDIDPGPYAELQIDNHEITGKLMGSPGGLACSEQEPENGRYHCIEQARPQLYRALTRAWYRLDADVVTRCLSRAGDGLSLVDCGVSRLAGGTIFSTAEGALP